jgi:hypothetical protein
MPSHGGNFAEVLMAGVPAKAKKNDRTLRDWFASYYEKRTTPAAPATKQCPPVGRTTVAIATAKETADAVIQAGRIRRGETELPVWQPPAQPRPMPMSAAEIIAAAKKRATPTSGTPMGAVAKAIILAGQRRRGEV